MPNVWQMKSHPNGLPSASDFELVRTEPAALASGQIRVGNDWLSVDPATRWRMDRSTSIVPLLPGDFMDGQAIGAVVETRSDRFAIGDIVSHGLGWRDEAVIDDKLASRLPDINVSPAAFLGQLGIPGLTAYVGLMDIASVAAGDTVFVSGAAGAVGLAAVQIAKLQGATVIGSAGGAEKCAIVRDFGADAAIDYKNGAGIASQLKAAAPDGIDVYFDNVGGDHFDAALGAARPFARFAICGMISEYSATTPTELRNLRRIISSNVTIRGFRVGGHVNRLPDFHAAARGWVAAGRFRTLETIREGLDKVPDAFVEMLGGGNRGKMVVRI